jgi:hypothetical protein
VLTNRLNAEVTRIVRAIEAEHRARDDDPIPQVSTADPDALVASAADKVVSIAAILKRGAVARMPATFWVTRQPFIERVPYFEAFADQAEPFLPDSLATELTQIVALVAAVTLPYGATR